MNERLTNQEVKELIERVGDDMAKLLIMARRSHDEQQEFEGAEKERKLNEKIMAKTSPLFLPAVSLSAEYLVMGHLLRRNILTYKAPPNNMGYDLICIHPDPTKAENHVRIQVKSRYQTDCDWKVFVKETSFEAFDFLAVALLNIGDFYNPRTEGDTGAQEPDIFLLPKEVALRYYATVKSGMNRVDLNKLTDEERAKYSLRGGVELVAQALGVPYPDREQLEQLPQD